MMRGKHNAGSSINGLEQTLSEARSSLGIEGIKGFIKEVSLKIKRQKTAELHPTSLTLA
jgi:hypothetical protein